MIHELHRKRKNARTGINANLLSLRPEQWAHVHQHEVITFPGARQVDDKELESTTLRLAAKLGHDTSNLKTVHLSGAFSGDKLYRIDTKSRTLVEITRPSQPRPKRRPSEKNIGIQSRSKAKKRRR
jgi:hypothetical protein